MSGGGTNLQAVLDAIDSGYIRNAAVAAVVSSNKKAYALERAKQKGIPSTYISKRQFQNPDEYDKAVIEYFESHGVGLVLMAGFLSIMGERFVNHYKNRIMNVHPALIPAFSGKGFYGIKVHEKVIEYGVKITGATVHFVELETDAGPIILQKAVEVRDGDTPEALQKRVMKEAEHKIFPEAVKLFTEGRLKLEGRWVRILPPRE